MVNNRVLGIYFFYIREKNIKKNIKININSM